MQQYAIHTARTSFIVMIHLNLQMVESIATDPRLKKDCKVNIWKNFLQNGFIFKNMIFSKKTGFYIYIQLLSLETVKNTITSD